MRTIIDRLGWVFAGVLSALVIVLVADVARGGPLDPEVPPASTRPQVEPRIPVSQPDAFPLVISQPGSYFLTEDIVGVAGQDGIRINGNNITLDLNGFSVRGVPGSGHGITTSLSSVLRVTIRNGRVVQWGGAGVRFPDTGALLESRIQNVTAGHNASHGFELAGADNVILDCEASNNAGVGVRLSTRESVTRDCHANRNGLQGFSVAGQDNLITRNTAMLNGVSGEGEYSGFWIQNTRHIVAENNAVANASHGFLFDGSHIVAYKNVSAYNFLTGFNITANCIVCSIGPIETLAVPNDPWANIER